MHFVRMPEDGIYRAGRWSDVEVFPEPAPAISFSAPLLDGYRWEDAAGAFATAKCSATAEAAIGRTIARYRKREVAPGTGIIDAILNFISGPADEGEPELVDGQVPEDVFDDLYLIQIRSDPGVLFVDLEHEDTHETLMELVGPALDALGVGPISEDLAREPDRRITRLAMRALHGACADGRFGPVAGIRYPGQPDPEWEAFVLWSEPALVQLTGDDVEFRWVARWDADLQAAADRIGVRIP